MSGWQEAPVLWRWKEHRARTGSSQCQILIAELNDRKQWQTDRVGGECHDQQNGQESDQIDLQQIALEGVADIVSDMGCLLRNCTQKKGFNCWD